MFSYCGPIQRTYYNLEPCIKVVLLSAGILLVIAGIWKGHVLALVHSKAAHWAFIGVGGLCVSWIVISMAKELRRRQKESYHLLDSPLLPYTPLAKEAKLEIPMRPITASGPVSPKFPEEIWKHIFSFLDVESLGKTQRVCSAFYNYTQQESFWKTPRGIDLPTFIDAPDSKQSVKVHMEFKRAVKKRDVSSYTLSDRIIHVENLFYVKDFLILGSAVSQIQFGS